MLKWGVRSNTCLCCSSPSLPVSCLSQLVRLSTTLLQYNFSLFHSSSSFFEEYFLFHVEIALVMFLYFTCAETSGSKCVRVRNTNKYLLLSNVYVIACAVACPFPLCFTNNPLPPLWKHLLIHGIHLKLYFLCSVCENETRIKGSLAYQVSSFYTKLILKMPCKWQSRFV